MPPSRFNQRVNTSPSQYQGSVGVAAPNYSHSGLIGSLGPNGRMPMHNNRPPFLSQFPEDLDLHAAKNLTNSQQQQQPLSAPSLISTSSINSDVPGFGSKGAWANSPIPLTPVSLTPGANSVGGRSSVFPNSEQFGEISNMYRYGNIYGGPAPPSSAPLPMSTFPKGYQQQQQQKQQQKQVSSLMGHVPLSQQYHKHLHYQAPQYSLMPSSAPLHYSFANSQSYPRANVHYQSQQQKLPMFDMPVVPKASHDFSQRLNMPYMPNGHLNTVLDPTGQTAPPGITPRVTTTLWEDENTLCLQVQAKGIYVARRQDNNMINGTKLLNVAGMSRGKRDGILKSEQHRNVIKIGAMHLKGVWITYERALEFANREKIIDLLYPLFVTDMKSYLYHPSNSCRVVAASVPATHRQNMNQRNMSHSKRNVSSNSPKPQSSFSSSYAVEQEDQQYHQQQIKLEELKSQMQATPTRSPARGDQRQQQQQQNYSQQPLDSLPSMNDSMLSSMDGRQYQTSVFQTPGGDFEQQSTTRPDFNTPSIVAMARRIATPGTPIQQQQQQQQQKQKQQECNGSTEVENGTLMPSASLWYEERQTDQDLLPGVGNY